MKRRYAVLSLFAGIVIGGYAIPMLHAQDSSEAAYLVCCNEILDAAKFKTDFLPQAQSTLKASGATTATSSPPSAPPADTVR